LTKFAGNYWNGNSSLARKIYVKNDTLRYARSETNESILVPISKTEFKMLNVGSNVIVKFSKDKEGSKVMSFSQNGSEPSISKEYQIKEYSQNELRNFEGIYYSKELDVTYDIRLKNESLILNLNGNEVSPLKVIMDNLFYNDRFGTMQFNKNSANEVSDFRLAAGRVKNLIFKKK